MRTKRKKIKQDNTQKWPVRAPVAIATGISPRQTSDSTRFLPIKRAIFPCDPFILFLFLSFLVRSSETRSEFSPTANLPTEFENRPRYRLGEKLCEEEIPEHGNTVTGISTPIATFQKLIADVSPRGEKRYKCGRGQTSIFHAALNRVVLSYSIP